jgi:tRNA threonylcarbamoyladenosine biosynthesis protein TsaE
MNPLIFQFRRDTENDTIRLAAMLGALAWEGMVLTIEGPLGAGKTVFARGFAQGLGITESITSPSYPIIQEYHGRLPFFHMDWYRLGSEDEVMETGAVEFLDGPGVALVEWPDRALELFDDQTIRLSIRIGRDQERTIRFQIESEAILARLGWLENPPPGLII